MRTLLAICVILFIVLMYLFFVDRGFFKEETGPIYFEIGDECSVVLGNLIHSINDEGECKLRCLNNCGIRDMEFENFEFVPKETSCSSCGCYCT